MKRSAYIVGLLALLGMARGGQEEAVADFVAAARTNDWATAQAVYDRIEWRDVKRPGKVLRELSQSLKGAEGAVGLRREIKTKYGLLRGDGDGELADRVAEIAVPVVALPVVRLTVAAMPVAGVTNGGAGVALGLVKERFTEPVKRWTDRYAGLEVYRDAHGNRVRPDWSGELGAEAEALKAAIRDGGDWEALWDAHEKHKGAAMGRRAVLGNGRKERGR
ncbi:MAG: hypothetical protein PHR35_15950 [Kiritimatiellae bacterium]|nr:hypothetical protein [Kiritimatiellia bacterium]